MRRFWHLLLSEFRSFRNTIPIHMIGIFQPALMFTLMALILVTPTFKMFIALPATPESTNLVNAMQQVGSPIGEPYIHPILIDNPQSGGTRNGQVIRIEPVNGILTAIQQFGLIDSNLVKNFRNRLTAAALVLWEDELGDSAVTIQQRPQLPRDIPFNTYFGMAMLPLAAFLTGSLIGGYSTAQEFELNTITEYRLSTTPMHSILGARLVRLSLTGLLSSLVLMTAVGFNSGLWPASILNAGLIFLVMGFLGGCLGCIAGLLLRSTLPSFVIGLGASFGTWILGGAFGLAAGFGGAYEAVSRWMPNTHAVELLTPLYYNLTVGSPPRSMLNLGCMAILMTGITFLVYHRRVLAQQR